MNVADIRFGRESSAAEIADGGFRFNLAVPALGENSALSFPLPSGAAGQEIPHGLLLQAGEVMCGLLRGTPGSELEASIGEMYDRMFQSLGRCHLYRIWHFVPAINEGRGDLENYRLFCRGRSEAFGRAFGESSQGQMPAASAVGSREREPVMFFVAGRAGPRHVENPEQVPAYRYPPIYGPRAPSFARASRVSLGQREFFFISGTASIKGSRTVHPGDCGSQVATTLHNLALIGEASGLGRDLARNSGASRRFVVYLRRREDLPLVESLLQEQLFAPGDESIFLLADICRSDLMVEIEATIDLPAAAVLPSA